MPDEIAKFTKLHGMRFRILDDHHQVTVTNDIMEWVRWANNPANWTIGHDELYHLGEQPVHVSTVFLHGFVQQNRARFCFETMVFGGKYDCYTYRYLTWADALVNHCVTVDRLSAGNSPFIGED